MGYVKEPEGVDFFVDSKPLSDKEKEEISEIIAYYKLTGRKKKLAPKTEHRTELLKKKKVHKLV